MSSWIIDKLLEFLDNKPEDIPKKYPMAFAGLVLMLIAFIQSFIFKNSELTYWVVGAGVILFLFGIRFYNKPEKK